MLCLHSQLVTGIVHIYKMQKVVNVWKLVMAGKHWWVGGGISEQRQKPLGYATEPYGTDHSAI